MAELDDDQFRNVLGQAFSDAQSYIDEDVADDRVAATKYYRGDPLGNEEVGRSQVVMTEVRDVVQAVMPSLLRVFCGSDRYAEFVPNRADQIAQADQATEYINHIIQNDNNGFLLFHSWMKDALVRKLGVVMFYKEDEVKIYERDFEGMPEEAVSLLEQDDDLEILETEEEDADEAEEPEIGPDGMPVPPQKTFKIRVRHKSEDVRFRVECLPPEEFLIARDARDLETTNYAARRQNVPISKLVAMGYDQAEIEENAGSADGFEMNEERETRNNFLNHRVADAAEADPMMREVLYVEHFIRADRDGDGIAEMRKVCTIGGSHYIIAEEVWDDVLPFATLCPDPEPHMVVGYSLADQVADLQEIKTAVVRNTLDSLAQSIHPDTVVVEGQVNMADVMNTEVGRIIRMRQPGMVQEFRPTFIGPAALEVINYLDRVRGQRTGITETTQGLDPDALQSTTKAAVTASTQAAQQRLEMIARIFAETGVKRLMKGLLRLVVRYQDKERVTRLRGSFVPVDPRYWDADMDVSVDVGVGTGNAQERMAILQQVFMVQQQFIQTMGPQNPIAGLIEMRNTMGKILQLGGFKDDARYFKPYGPTQEMADAQQAEQAKSQQPKGQDPAALLASVETAKVQAQRQTDQEKNQLKLLELQQKDDRERDAMAQKYTLENAKLQQQAVSKQQEQAMRFEMDRQRMAMTPPPQPGVPPNGP